MINVSTYIKSNVQYSVRVLFIFIKYELYILNGKKNSRQYRLKCRELLEKSIGVTPAYQTRIRDGIAIRPDQRAFTSAYNLLHLPLITFKTQETAFQNLNRTTWTNNKAFKSRRTLDPNCERCGRVETMEHLLCECEYYSECLWN
jgi:hypothetical protein